LVGVGLAIGVLGPLQVLVDGVDVTPRAAKERALLTLLVLDHDRVVGVATTGTGGGILALAAEVRSSRQRLIAALGPRRFADHQSRVRTLSPETASAELLLKLRAAAENPAQNSL
jgi:hypothetical protein